MSGNIQSTVALTITEKNGAVRNRKLTMYTKSYDDGTIKRMVKFLDPADVRGTAMLIVDKRQARRHVDLSSGAEKDPAYCQH